MPSQPFHFLYDAGAFGEGALDHHVFAQDAAPKQSNGNPYSRQTRSCDLCDRHPPLLLRTLS
ncbi:hypothetical protein SBA6_500074 [Candidatus Sulfopaludibacter sp. SbA6]|nr:hypothetical protein SBA6_500074 [Candidatus Sulfopaludibacter sp. SbA6]